MQELSRIALMKDGSLLIVKTFDEPLRLDGVAFFQAHIGIRLRNPQEPKLTFNT